MVKLNVPEKLTLPNVRTFYARYKRVKINSFPDNIRLRRRYRRRRNNNQKGRGLKDVFRKGF